MSIVTSIHLRIVGCHCRVEEGPFLDEEKPTLLSLQLMSRRVLHIPSN